MPLPAFNAYGLLPEGVHTTTLEELEQRLGFSARRLDLIQNGLKPMASRLAALGAKEMCLDGSFATAHPAPGDIDGYVPTTFGSPVHLEWLAQRRVWKERYQMDLYPAFTDVQGGGSIDDWRAFFSQTTDEPPRVRGIVQLILGR